MGKSAQQQSEEYYKVALRLIELGKRITEYLIVDDIIKVSFKSIQSLFDASRFSIGLYKDELDGLEIYGMRNNKKDTYQRFENMSDPSRWSVFVYTSQENVLYTNRDQYHDKYFSNLLFPESNDCRSFIYLPITLHGKRIGVLSVQSEKKEAYSQFHLEIMKNLSTYIAIALSNAETHKRTEEQKEKLQRITIELETVKNNLAKQVTIRTKKILEQNKELERLSLVAKKTNNAIMIMNGNGDVLWVNEFFNRLYNYQSFEHFIKVRGTNILQTSFNPNIKTLFDQCRKTKKTVYYSAFNVGGDGKGIWTQTTLTPVLDDKNKITHLLTIDSDITSLKEAQIKIETQSRDITDSIQCAARIQKALLPLDKELKRNFSDYFVVYQPRDIVSGDFYFVYRHHYCLVIAVADCTGHGVPGAFMSMLGISFLNQILRLDSLSSSAIILEQLRTLIKKSLRQTGKTNEINEGMDIALCIVNLKNQEMCFSGAFNSLLVYSQGSLTEYKGDKMPIGVYIKDDLPFTEQKIKLNKDDIFYLYTDGVYDQFGGPNDRKFGLKRLKNLIAENANKSMDKQKLILEKTLLNWTNPDSGQTDDRCLLGFKI